MPTPTFSLDLGSGGLENTKGVPGRCTRASNSTTPCVCSETSTEGIAALVCRSCWLTGALGARGAGITLWDQPLPGCAAFALPWPRWSRLWGAALPQGLPKPEPSSAQSSGSPSAPQFNQLAVGNEQSLQQSPWLVRASSQHPSWKILWQRAPRPPSSASELIGGQRLQGGM